MLRLDNEPDTFEDPSSLKDVRRKQKDFQDKFQKLLDGVNQVKLKTTHYSMWKTIDEFNDNKVEELRSMFKQQKKMQQVLLAEHKEITESQKKIETRIDELFEALEEGKKDLSIRKKDLEQTKSPLVTAIKRYSKYLDMHIKTEKLDSECFLASICFCLPKDQNMVTDLILDRKNRCIKDFSAHGMSEEDAAKIKEEAMTQKGLDKTIILTKLREISLVKT